jgi:hypothetical protein
MPPPRILETIPCFLRKRDVYAESLQATRASGGSVVNTECLNPERAYPD